MEETQAFLNRVQSPFLPGIFVVETTEISYKPLPFFQNTRHIVLENLAVAPPLSLEYLMRGDDIFYLDGSDAPLKALCEKGALILKAETVVDYLEFHCAVVVERPDDILLFRPSPALRRFKDPVHYLDFQFDQNNFGEHDITVNMRPDKGFTVHAAFVFDGKIDPATAHISTNGDITINRREGI